MVGLAFKLRKRNKNELTRSASPTRSEDGSSSENEKEAPVEPIRQDRNPINGFIINGIQPFTPGKSYRPICFNPQAQIQVQSTPLPPPPPPLPPQPILI